MIQNNMYFSITELSNLTGKTRPTIYKYVNAYDSGDLDSIPYTFIQLFNLMEKPNVKRVDIINFCNNNFIEAETDDELNSFIKFVRKNKDKINLNKVRLFIEEEIKNGRDN